MLLLMFAIKIRFTKFWLEVLLKQLKLDVVY